MLRGLVRPESHPLPTSLAPRKTSARDECDLMLLRMIVAIESVVNDVVNPGNRDLLTGTKLPGRVCSLVLFLGVERGHTSHDKAADRSRSPGLEKIAPPRFLHRILSFLFVLI